MLVSAGGLCALPDASEASKAEKGLLKRTWWNIVDGMKAACCSMLELKNIVVVFCSSLNWRCIA